MGSPDAGATNLTDAAAELLAAHDCVQSPLEEDASIVRTPPATSQSPCVSQHVHAASPVPSCSLAVPYSAQAEDATQACFFAATSKMARRLQSGHLGLDARYGRNRWPSSACSEASRSQVVTGVQPRGCTWDYKCGLWRYENGTPRQADQTKRDNAAHRWPRRYCSIASDSRLFVKL